MITGMPWTFFTTPWGSGRVFVSEGTLAGVELPRLGQSPRSESGLMPPKAAGEPLLRRDADALLLWAERLEAYFRGERLAFGLDEVPLKKLASTAFRLHVYRSLLQVPPGETVSYGELALLAGYPRAARAVGTAMATNPVPVVLPCHRVVLADGRLGRYGEDPAWKELLLEHERTHVSQGSLAHAAGSPPGRLGEGLVSDGQG